MFLDERLGTLGEKIFMVTKVFHLRNYSPFPRSSFYRRRHYTVLFLTNCYFFREGNIDWSVTIYPLSSFKVESDVNVSISTSAVLFRLICSPHKSQTTPSA